MKKSLLESILAQGNEFGKTDPEKRKIRIANLLSCFFCLTNILYTILLTSFGVFYYSWVLQVGTVALISVILLNKYGYNKAGRLLVIIDSILTVFLL